MKMQNRYILVVLSLFFAFSGNAQEELTMEQAIQEALAKNNNILIAKNNQAISENLANKGQAGMLPTVSASGLVDYGVDNTRLQVANSEQVIEANGAQSIVFNASVSADYTLFNGFIGQKTLEKLNNSVMLGDAQSRKQIETTILQVVSVYYNFIRTRDNLEVLSEAVVLSENRYDLASKRKEFSGGSSLNVLNAEVDLNQDKMSLLEGELAHEEVKIQLNQLLGRALDAQIDCKDDITFDLDLNYMLLLQELKDQNADVQEMRWTEQNSILDYKIARSAYSPRLDLNSSYSYNKTDAEGSFLALNETNGLGVRLTLSVPIYAGGTRKVNEQNAAIRMENSMLQLREVTLNLERELLTAFKDFNNAMTRIEFEQTNVVTAERNFEFSEDKYKLGQLTNTEFRQAQMNVLLAKNNLNNMKYNAKLAELELLRLTGKLIGK